MSDPSELLARVAETVRNDIAPAVDEEYARTQAFMASVILQRLSRQVALGPQHGAAELADLQALRLDLEPLLVDAPVEVRDAAAAIDAVADLGPFLHLLYGWGMREAPARAARDAVRRCLRMDIDRRMEIAT